MSRSIAAGALIVLGFAASLAVGGCAYPPRRLERPPAPTSLSSVEAAAAIAARPRPIKGWDPAYDLHVREAVARAPALLELAPARMSGLCPAWAKLNRAERQAFYADLLHAIAWPESRHDRRAMYQETGIVDRATGRQVIDAVTGRPIVSEGLLQLSYADALVYRPAEGLACAFDWERDREPFLADLAAGGTRRSFASSHPDRSILDPYVQLTCAVHILDVLVRKRPDRDFRTAAGAYWSTMRPTKPAHADVLRGLRKRASPCFDGT